MGCCILDILEQPLFCKICITVEGNEILGVCSEVKKECGKSENVQRTTDICLVSTSIVSNLCLLSALGGMTGFGRFFAFSSLGL